MPSHRTILKDFERAFANELDSLSESIDFRDGFSDSCRYAIPPRNDPDYLSGFDMGADFIRRFFEERRGAIDAAFRAEDRSLDRRLALKYEEDKRLNPSRYLEES